jgi:two-component sensor histidine kinase
MQEAGRRIDAEQQFRKRTVEELAHRLRNKVATIQAVLLFQLSAHPRLRDEALARLRALAQTDELIIAAQGRGAGLREVILTEVRPYDVSRVSAHGSDVFLEPKLALTMALLFHELATNAAKYGALSDAKGHVTIRWSATGGRLNIEWRESGGPEVSEPLRRGFGTKLVVGALAAFGGKAEAAFEPTGLVVQMNVVLPDHPVSVDAASTTSQRIEPSSTQAV